MDGISDHTTETRRRVSGMARTGCRSFGEQSAGDPAPPARYDRPLAAVGLGGGYCGRAGDGVEPGGPGAGRVWGPRASCESGWRRARLIDSGVRSRVTVVRSIHTGIRGSNSGNAILPAHEPRNALI